MSEKYKEAEANGDAGAKKKLREIYKRLTERQSDRILECRAKFGRAVGGMVEYGEEGEAKNKLIGTDDTIDGIKIIDGKVARKIPINEFTALRELSIKNPDADSMTLGKYTRGPDSYIAKAGTDSTYFDMGDEWGSVQKKYQLTDAQMFEYFNRPALDDAISNGKTIRFSHDPRIAKGYLGQEWLYIKNKLRITNNDLKENGGLWYVK